MMTTFNPNAFDSRRNIREMGRIMRQRIYIHKHHDLITRIGNFMTQVASLTRLTDKNEYNWYGYLDYDEASLDQTYIGSDTVGLLLCRSLDECVRRSVHNFFFSHTKTSAAVVGG